MVGTIPADIVQYFAALFKILQELLYINGARELNLEEIDECTKNKVIIFMGIMFGVEAANKFIANIAIKSSKSFAKKASQRIIFRSSLGCIYPIVKKICKAIGLKLSKQAFAKSASKVVPVLGGIASGGLTYFTFKPCAKNLQKALSEIDLQLFEENFENEISDINDIDEL